MNEGIKELIDQIRKKPFIENVKEMLHELNFEFMDSEILQHLAGIKFESKWHIRYQWMVRLCWGENSKVTRHDFDLVVGIRFLDFRSPNIVLYKKGKFLEEIKKPWKVPIEVNAKKKKVPLTFPDEMSIQDRIDWRKYHKKSQNGKKLLDGELSYYTRWKPLIGNLDKEFDHL